MIDSKKKILYTMEAKLLMGVISDIDNFNLLEEKSKKDEIFSIDEYKKLYEVIKILYTKQNYTQIDEFALSTFLNSLSISQERKDTCLSIFNIIVESNKETTIDFDGVLEQYTLLKIPMRLYDKIMANGGLENYINTLSEFKSAEDLSLYLEGMITDITQIGKEDTNLVKTNITNEITKEFIEKTKQGTTIESVPFKENYKYLNKYLRGIVRGVNGIGGFSGTGKTSMLVTMYLLSVLENTNDKICLFCNEQVYEVFIQFITFAYISNIFIYMENLKEPKLISRQDFSENILSDDDLDYFINAMKHWSDKYKNRILHIYFESMKPELLRKEIKKLYRQGYKYYVYDTFKADEEEYKDIVELSRVIDSLTKRYPITSIITLQLAGDNLGIKYLTSRALARAKAIKEILENLVLFRKVEREELGGLTVKTYDKKTNSIKEIPINLESDNYYALFIDKSRLGKSGKCILYEIDLDYLIYNEIGIITNMPKDYLRK